LFQGIIVEHPTSGQCLSNPLDLFSSRIQSILECLSHFVSNSVVIVFLVLYIFLDGLTRFTLTLYVCLRTPSRE